MGGGRSALVVAMACIAPWGRPSLHVAALGAPAAFAPAPALSVGRCAARPGTCLQTRATRRRTANRLAGALRAKGEDDPADQSGEKEDGEEMSKFNAEIYSELRDHFAVSAEQPTIASKRGGSEVFTYMPPSFRDREATQRLLPSPEFTPQEVISTILQAMKANRKFGCSIYLRFMSDKHEYSRLTGEDLQLQLEMGGQTQVLLGNFREFSFPTPTFEVGSDSDSPVAIQTVRLLVPGFMAAMMGASRGWTAEARIRWRLSKDPASQAWLVDEAVLIPCDDNLTS